MSRQSIQVTLGVGHGEGRYGSSARPTGPGADASSIVADVATMVAAQTPAAAAMAVLVADGATPTQAHVTTMNTAYGTLATAVATVAADATALNAAVGGDVQIIFNTATITTVTQLKRAFDAALQAAASGGILTP